MGRERLEAEFGRYQRLVVDALRQHPDPLPAACRGLGGPWLLEEIAGAAAIGEGARVLDVGCGPGGPAAWFARRGSEVFALDVMPAAVEGARSLFPELRVARASWRSLPFSDGGFDHLVALGVLELIAGKDACLSETRRVLRPGGTAALFDYLRTVPDPLDAPTANRFITHAGLLSLADDAGLTVALDRPVDRTLVETGPWRAAARSLEEEVRERNEGDPAWQAARREKALFQRLHDQGQIAPRLMVLTS